MAQVMSDYKSSQLESISAASLSGISLSLATVISHHHRQLLREGEVGPGGVAGGGEGGEQRDKEGGEAVTKRDGGELRNGETGVGVRGKEGGMGKEVTEPANEATVSAKLPSASPNTSHTEDGVQCLLENVPQVKEEFEIITKIGEGTFSSVYLAGLRGRSEMKFALKHLVPTSASSRIENELKCLQSMGGRDNVIPLLTCVRHRDHVVLIMPYFPHSRFTDYLPVMTPSEVQRYMRALFTALCNVHSHRVIHRDIKPSNFLYNRDTARFQLVDFGLAHLEPAAISSAPSSSSSASSSTQTVHPKTKLRGSRTTQPSLSTPPASSSALLVTKAPLTAGTTTTTTHSQVHINGAALVPPQTYRRPIHGNVQARASTSVTLAMQQRDRERGRGRGRGDGAVTMGRKGRGVGERGKLGGGGQRAGGSSESGTCPLRHKPNELCDVCQNRGHQNAPRAGTPGFRAPEVLLKCPLQTTAVDVWSAGVIFLCLLSGRYPFFRAPDDLSALAQIIALMGTTEYTRAARQLGKELVCGQHIEPVDLRELCRTLRRTLHSHLIQQQQQHKKQQQSAPSHDRHSAEMPCKRTRLTTNGGDTTTTTTAAAPAECSLMPCRYELRSPQRRKNPLKRSHMPARPNLKSTAASSSTPSVDQSVSVCSNAREVAKSWESLPDSAYDLLYKCLELNPSQRITAQLALQHPFLAGDRAR